MYIVIFQAVDFLVYVYVYSNKVKTLHIILLYSFLNMSPDFIL